MNDVAEPAVQWVTASPLWKKAIDPSDDDVDRAIMIKRPALLRFATDSFMDELTAALHSKSKDLDPYRAKPISFRPAPPGAPDEWSPDLPQLKLFQAIHGDFNLVSASLVCRMPGMPDHTVHPADDEKVSFVLRRIDRADEGETVELAWADDPKAKGGKSWLPIGFGEGDAVAHGEQLFPMFPVGFDEGSQPRRLFVGLVPVSSGESFKAAGRMDPFPDQPSVPGAKPEGDPRVDELDTKVIEPLVVLRDPNLPANVTDDQKEESSAFLLIDFADFLNRNLKELWIALESGVAPQGGPVLAVYNELKKAADTSPLQTWRQALTQAWNERMSIAGESDQPQTLKCDLGHSATDPGTLRGLMILALPPLPVGTTTASSAGTTALDLSVPKLDPAGLATYWIRCVYRRPHCLPPKRELVSQPSEEFAIASLFDPDAPARQIRIPLPIDTSMKDLRKFKKSVGFLISNQLRDQMNRVTDLKKAMDGDLGEAESLDLGMLCSFSIPIITICALIVLMIFVSLLNIVFFWVPFLKICLPIPLRSKR